MGVSSPPPFWMMGPRFTCWLEAEGAEPEFLLPLCHPALLRLTLSPVSGCLISTTTERTGFNIKCQLAGGHAETCSIFLSEVVMLNGSEHKCQPQLLHTCAVAACTLALQVFLKMVLSDWLNVHTNMHTFL